MASDNLQNFLLAIVVTALFAAIVYLGWGYTKTHSSGQNLRFNESNQFWIIGLFVVLIGLTVLLSLSKTGMLGIEYYKNSEEQRTM